VPAQKGIPLSRLGDVNHFIAASRAARSSDELRAIMEPMAREMGFDYYALFQHVKSFSWNRKKGLAISNFPRGWVDYFIENRFSADDPIHLASYRTGVGFAFDQIPSLITVSEKQQRIMEASRRAGLTDGFCVPAHIPGETNGTCTFVVKDGAELPRANLPMAQLVGSFAYEAARQLVLRSEGSIEGEVPKSLTTRQLECVALVGRGKSDWEIAQILGIREDTVTDHINEARRRVGVSRRAELPIHALFRGDLTFRDILH
jgi:LuxR family quorum-sensing system transcriptional regulator CciR